MFDEQNYLKVTTVLHSPEWFKIRTIGGNVPGVGFYAGGIGASESAKLIIDDKTKLPINPYSPSPAELFEHKVGREAPTEFANEATLWGTEDEASVLNMWRFWDGIEGGYVTHRMNWRKAKPKDKPKHVQREYVRAPYYLINTEYPQLFASLDAVIPAGQPNMITGEVLSKPAPLEAKVIGEYTAREYESGVPAQYVVQLHHQMMVAGSDYGEIVMKKAGQKLLVRYFERNEELCQLIDRVTKDFWFGRVLPARKLYAQALKSKKEGDEITFANLMEKVDQLQPGPDSSPAYAKWATDRFVRSRSFVIGTQDQYETLREYALISEYIKTLEDAKALRKNELIKHMSDLQTGEIIFDDKSYLRMGKYLYAGFKQKFSKEAIRKHIGGLPLDLQGVVDEETHEV